MRSKSRYNHLKQSNYMQKGRDVYYPIAKRSLPLSDYKKRLWSQNYAVTKKNREIEDRRTFKPDRPYLNPLTKQASPTRVKIKSVYDETSLYPSSKLTFFNPENVLVCVRRSIRRQVMHAKGIAGSRGLSSPRYNELSRISCGG